MRVEGVERYIGMATPSLRDPRDTPSLLGRRGSFVSLWEPNRALARNGIAHR
jgi:hypothetical protein